MIDAIGTVNTPKNRVYLVQQLDMEQILEELLVGLGIASFVIQITEFC